MINLDVYIPCNDLVNEQTHKYLFIFKLINKMKGINIPHIFLFIIVILYVIPN